MPTESDIGFSIVPMLSVRDGAGAVEFYKTAFCAVEVYRMEDPSGAVVSRLSVAGAEFWLTDESPEYGNFSPESLGGGTVRMILTVPDPDALFAQAVAAGWQAVTLGPRILRAETAAITAAGLILHRLGDLG